MTSYLLASPAGLDEAKRGRPFGTFKDSLEDRDYVMSKGAKSSIAAHVKKWRQWFLGILKKHDIKYAKDAQLSLKDMEKIIKDAGHGDDIEAYRNNSRKHKDLAWHKLEDAVVEGLQEFFDSGLVTVDGNSISKGHCKVHNAGGSVESDISVTNTKNNKKFAVECKLNFVSAEYFKYFVTVQNGKIRYSHDKYVTKDMTSDDKAAIDDLFDKQIDIDSFIQQIIESNEVSHAWREFTSNVDRMCEWLKNGDALDGTDDREFKAWFKQACNGSNLVSGHMSKKPDRWTIEDWTFSKGKFPDMFQDVANVFDRFVKYYTDSYNLLIDEILKDLNQTHIDLFSKLEGEKSLQLEDYKVPSKKRSHGDVGSSSILEYLNNLMASIAAHNRFAEEVNAGMDDPEYEIELIDADKIGQLIEQIKKIEAKLNTLLVKVLKTSPNDFSKFDDPQFTKNKFMYFYQLFLSSTSRKSKGQQDVLVDDSKGVLQLFPEFHAKSTRLGQMITDFYVKKDGCAFIQVADRVYAFADKNPLNLEKLPVFKDTIQHFVVKFTVSSKLDYIRMHIVAVQPDSSVYNGKLNVSFAPKDSNFICKVLKKPIEVVTKK